MIDKTSTAKEVLDLVDEDDQIIGEVTKEEANRNPNLTHREVLIIIYDYRNRVLLQQRSHQKQIKPLYWVESCAGHVPQGMTPEQAAHKELREELGFDVPLVFVEKGLDKNEREARFMYWFLGKYDGQEIRVDLNEVEKAKFFSREEFSDLVRSGAPVGRHSRQAIEKFWSGKFKGKVGVF